MNKKSGMFFVFSLYLFLLLSNQHARGIAAVANPVADMLGVAATAVVDIAHNAYQGYLEKNKKEDLEKAKQQLLSIKTDLQTLEGLNSESFTYQFLRQYSYPQTQNVPSNELISLEKQVNEIQNLLVLHLNQLIENVSWVEALYQNAMVEITKVMEIWNNNSKAIAPEVAFKVYEHYLLREHLITRIRYLFNEVQIVARYYRVCKNESIKLIVANIAALGQIVSVVEAKKSWLLEEERQARSGSAILERYFASRNISVSTLKSGTQKEVNEAFKKHNADVLKKLTIQQQANSGFGGGPRKDDEEDEIEDSSSIVKISKDDAPHMFGNRLGHLIDTPANRKLLIDLASKKENFLGIDSYGTAWYGEILKDGKQLWATVGNNLIRNGGINDVLREFNPKTGLSRSAR